MRQSGCRPHIRHGGCWDRAASRSPPLRASRRRSRAAVAPQAFDAGPASRHPRACPHLRARATPRDRAAIPRTASSPALSLRIRDGARRRRAASPPSSASGTRRAAARAAACANHVLRRVDGARLVVDDRAAVRRTARRRDRASGRNVRPPSVDGALRLGTHHGERRPRALEGLDPLRPRSPAMRSASAAAIAGGSSVPARRRDLPQRRFAARVDALAQRLRDRARRARRASRRPSRTPPSSRAPAGRARS